MPWCNRAVDAQQDFRRVAEFLADGLGAGTDCLASGLLIQCSGRDRDRERSHPHGAESDLHHTELGTHTDRPSGRLVSGEASGEVEEVCGTAGEVEADQIGAEKTFDDLGTPRHLHEQLDRRERDVEEEPDGEIGPQHAEHLRDQLELVVLDPHRRAVRGGLRRCFGESPIHLDVGVPPLARYSGRTMTSW